MSLAVSADSLRTLHRLHRQLADLRDQLSAGPRQLVARTKQLQAAEATQAAVQDEIKKAKMVVDQKQLQLRSAESKILDLEGKLNACKTNREYQTLRDQVAADKMATTVLEDEILEALERLDSVKNKLAPIDVEIATAKRLLAETQAKVDGESAKLETEVARIKADLDAAEGELPVDSREVYRRIVKSKGAEAMAAVEGESCGGCFQQLTGNMLAELSMGRVVPCRNCGCLLYLSK
ncbi:MAG: phospholipase [Planctomycetia bacterium]|jgi:predicted  nucleic acid-binding Zn-ribbon protein|nr:phospholipase [Planctomycetia bacterium]